MLGVKVFETTSLRLCGLGRSCDAAGFGAFEASFWGDCAFSTVALGMCWPDRISGSGTLPVSRLCDTVVILARKGRRKVGGSIDRDSRSALRLERTNSAIGMCAMAWLLLGIVWLRCGVWGLKIRGCTIGLARWANVELLRF